jgi:hypothetical protein
MQLSLPQARYVNTPWAKECGTLVL